MKYFKMRVKESNSEVPEDLLISDLLRNIGTVLIVCDNYQQSTEIANRLHSLLSHTKYVKRDGVLSDSLSRFLFKCSSNYLDYCGMECSCVYVVNTKPKELKQRLVTMVRERR